MFGEGVGDLSVQFVSQGPRDTFPGYNDDDDDSVGTVMARTLPHQTQQLLFLAAPSDHLTGNKAGELSFVHTNPILESKIYFQLNDKMLQELLVVPTFVQQMSSTPKYFDMLTQFRHF